MRKTWEQSNGPARGYWRSAVVTQRMKPQVLRSGTAFLPIKSKTRKAELTHSPIEEMVKTDGASGGTITQAVPLADHLLPARIILRTRFMRII